MNISKQNALNSVKTAVKITNVFIEPVEYSSIELSFGAEDLIPLHEITNEIKEEYFPLSLGSTEDNMIDSLAIQPIKEEIHATQWFAKVESADTLPFMEIKKEITEN